MSKSRRERRRAERERARSTDSARHPTGGLRLPFERREWIVLGLILLVGLGLRVAYLGEIEGTPSFRNPAFDAAFHDYWARSLAGGTWSAPQYYDDPHIQTTPFFRPPGYPYFLAAVYTVTGGSYTAARVVQMLFGLLSCVLAFLLGRRLFGSAVGLFFAAFMSCYWIFIYFEGELLAPVLLVFLVLAVLNVIVRWQDGTTYRNTVGAGVLLGLLALVRPNALVLAPIALVWVWWVARRRRDARRFRVALLGFPIAVALTIAPATIRNYVVAHDLVWITSNAGLNLYIGNNEYTDCVSANVPILKEHSTLASWTCFDEPAIAAAVERIEGRTMKASEVSSFFADKAFDFIKSHAGQAAALAWKKALYFWGPAEVSNNKVIQLEKSHSRVLEFLPGFPLALALALVGLVLLVLDLRASRGQTAPAPDSARGFEAAVLLVSFVVVYFASYLPFFIAGRYRVPIIPILLLFAAYGAEVVRSRIAARRTAQAAVWIGVFLVAYLGTSRQLAAYQPDPGMWHFDRGDAYRKAGQIERAADEFRLATETATTPYAVAYNNLAVALGQLGRQDESIERYKQAIELRPDYLDARQNLVGVLLRMNRVAEAHEQLLEIARLAPDDATAQFNLGVSFLRQSKFDDAVDHLSRAVKLNPSLFNAQHFLAQALALAGRRDEAIERYRFIVEAAPKQVEVRFELATLLSAAGDKEGAIANARRVLELQPNHAGARALLDKLTSK